MDVKYKINKNGNCRLCQNKDETDNMVACDDCDRWFHLGCANLNRLPTAKETWSCKKCKKTKTDFDLLQDKFDRLANQKVKEDEANTKQVAVMDAMIKKIEEINVGNHTATEKYILRQSMSDLPYFDGNYKMWPRFRQTFFETTKQGNFSDIENINRLQKCRKGDALRAVSSLLLDPNNIHAILSKLED